MPQTEQMERYSETQTSTTHLIFSVAAGKDEVLSGASEWLDAASLQEVASLFKMSAREQTTRTACLLPPLKYRSDKLFFCLLFCVDTSNLLHAVWRSGVVCWISKISKYTHPLALPICRGLWLWFSTLPSISGTSKFLPQEHFLHARFLFGNK